MSRAFVNEQDGWSFCREKMRECMMAKPDGGCSLRKCKFEKEENSNPPVRPKAQ